MTPQLQFVLNLPIQSHNDYYGVYFVIETVYSLEFSLLVQPETLNFGDADSPARTTNSFRDASLRRSQTHEKIKVVTSLVD